MTYFRSKRDRLTTIICWSLVAVGLVTAVIIELLIMQLFMVLISVFVLSLLYGTSYKLTEDTLFYRTGPISGSIPISKIREVEINITMYVGWKPATSANGIILKYNRFDDMYISPDSNESFVEQLLMIRPDLKVIRHEA